MVGIYDSSGNKIAEYAYDAFGNCTFTYGYSNEFSRINPIRYRGYYLDRETNLYYLNSRYYNPEWRRFLSPDSTSYLDPENVNGLNLYAYCNNDPVNYADPSGHFAISTFLICLGIGIVAGGALGAVSAAQQNTDVWRGILVGSLLGAIIGAGVGLALAGTAGGVAAKVGTSFIKSGTKTFMGKFTADLVANIAFDKPMSSIEGYMSAFAFGGTIGAITGSINFGNSQWIQKSIRLGADVVLRPAYNILIDDMLFKGNEWSTQKYQVNFAIRLITCGYSEYKPILRGVLNGMYYQYSLK